MKVAFIGQKGIPAESGGVERHVEEIAARLAAWGVDVTVYCRSTYSKGQCSMYCGIRRKLINTVDNKYLDAIVYTLKATLDAVREGYDIYHYHSIGPSSLIFIPFILKRKIIATIHGLDYERGKWGRFARAYLKLGEWMAARLAHRVIAVSCSIRDHMMARYGRGEYEIIFIPNGVNKPCTLPPHEIKRFGLEAGGYILYLSRLVPEKGAHYLIDAYKSLDTCKKLVIAGGHSYTPDYEKRIKDMAGDDDRIIFTGSVGGNLLAELYGNCYIYVLPSEVEGMPITLLEALSYGKHCVVSDIPENRYVIRDGVYGSLFKSGDSRDLHEKLAYLLDNPEFASQGALASKQYADSTFSWDTIAKATLAVYKSLGDSSAKSNIRESIDRDGSCPFPETCWDGSSGGDGSSAGGDGSCQSAENPENIGGRFI